MTQPDRPIMASSAGAAVPLDHGIAPNPYNPHAWIHGDPEIGPGTWIGPFTRLDGQGGLKIGQGCNISTGSQILTHTTVRRCLSEGAYNLIDRRPTVVEDYVFIGSNAVVLMGCRIGHHSIVAAGAVVLEGTEVPPYTLMAGVPARAIRCLREDVERWRQGPPPREPTRATNASEQET